MLSGWRRTLVVGEPREGTAALQQLVVAPLLDDSPLIEDDDVISVADGAEAMRDDDRRAAALVRAFLDTESVKDPARIVEVIAPGFD